MSKSPHYCKLLRRHLIPGELLRYRTFIRPETPYLGETSKSHFLGLFPSRGIGLRLSLGGWHQVNIGYHNRFWEALQKLAILIIDPFQQKPLEPIYEKPGYRSHSMLIFIKELPSSVQEIFPPRRVSMFFYLYLDNNSLVNKSKIKGVILVIETYASFLSFWYVWFLKTLDCGYLFDRYPIYTPVKIVALCDRLIPKTCGKFSTPL